MFVPKVAPAKRRLDKTWKISPDPRMVLVRAKGVLVKDPTVRCGLARRDREDLVQVPMMVCTEETGTIFRGRAQAHQAKDSAAAINHILV